MIAGETLAEAYLHACEIELNAFKPGNVSIYAAGHDMTVDQFRRSAEVSAPFLVERGLALGEKIYRAVAATHAAVGCNTNLGIVLLCAPLLQAVATVDDGDLRARVRVILDSTSREDADWVYQAIRMASPGGLGNSVREDVGQAPTVNLREAMKLATDRDRIAWQYENCYADVFDFAINRYHTAFERWGKEAWAALAVYLGLLRREPDSHMVRKFGDRFTRTVAARAACLDEELSQAERPEMLFERLREVDAEFKSLGINPGTTADLTVASLLAVRLEILLSYGN